MTNSRIFLLLFLSLMSNYVLAADRNQILQDYVANLQTEIKKKWKPQRRGKDYKILASFILDENGEVSDIKLLEKSPDREDNDIAVKAIKTAGPFPRPVSIRSDDSIGPLEIEFSFDYTVAQTKKGKTKNTTMSQVSDSVLMKDRKPSSAFKLLKTIVTAIFILLIFAPRVYEFFDGGVTKKNQDKMSVKNKSISRYDPTNVD